MRKRWSSMCKITNQEETAMPTYVVINRANNFDPMNNREFADTESAIAAAKEQLQVQPSQELYIAQLLTKVSASVRVSSSEVGDPVAASQSGDQPSS